MLKIYNFDNLFIYAIYFNIAIVNFFKIGDRSVSLSYENNDSQMNCLEDLTSTNEVKDSNIDTEIFENPTVQSNVDLDVEVMPIILSETSSVPNELPSDDLILNQISTNNLNASNNSENICLGEHIIIEKALISNGDFTSEVELVDPSLEQLEENSSAEVENSNFIDISKIHF